MAGFSAVCGLLKRRFCGEGRLSDRAWRDDRGSQQHPLRWWAWSAKFHGAKQFVWPDYWIPMANERAGGRGRITCIAGPHRGYGDWAGLSRGRDCAAGDGKSNASGPRWRRSIGERRRAAAAADHPGLTGITGMVIRGFLYSRDRAGAAGAGGGVRELVNAVCGARGAIAAGKKTWRLRVAWGRAGAVEATAEPRRVMVSLMGGAAGLAAGTACWVC